MRGLESSHLRHPQIHHDQVRVAPSRRVNRLLSTRSRQHFESHRFKYLLEQMTVFLLIIGDHDALSCALVTDDAPVYGHVCLRLPHDR